MDSDGFSSRTFGMRGLAPTGVAPTANIVREMLDGGLLQCAAYRISTKLMDSAVTTTEAAALIQALIAIANYEPGQRQ